MTIKYVVFAFSLAISLSFAACASQNLASEQVNTQTKSQFFSEKAVKAEWKLEWEQIMAEARKEGRPILYTTAQAEVRQAISDGFKKSTGIELEIITGRGQEITAKLLSERRAGLYLADIYIGGTTTLVSQIKPAGILRPIMQELFLPEVLDTKLWYKGALPFLDKDKLILVTRMMPGGSQADVAFNPKLVNRAELASWYDLLKPKFKGKMNMQDPTTAGKGGKFVNKALTYYGLDWAFFRDLAKQEPFVTRDERLMIDWVARGKHLLAISPDSSITHEFQKAGADVDYVIFKETKDILGGASSGVALIANPPHPIGAKLLLNWFLSKEGQTVFARSYALQSAREDTPTDHLPDFQIRKPGVEYPVETEEFLLQEPKLRPIIIEIFGPLLK